MKHILTRLFFMLAVVAALGESTARAELVDFSYAWSIQPSAVLPGGTGSVQVSLTPNASSSGTLGVSTPIPLATLTTTSTASAGSPDSFNNPFSLKLSLTDTASGNTGTLSFGGTISGTLTFDCSLLTGKFDNPMQVLHLGTHDYAVTIDTPNFGLQKPNSDGNTLIGAFVLVTNTSNTGGGGGGNPGPTPDAPEPSSLVLGGMALAGLAARRWSRLKKRAV